jgi:hypothetical protein
MSEAALEPICLAEIPFAWSLVGNACLPCLLHVTF